MEQKMSQINAVYQSQLSQLLLTKNVPDITYNILEHKKLHRTQNDREQ